MAMLRSPRFLFAVGCFAALAAASQLGASDRSAGAMAAAANRFLEGLTPEQRQKASFPFSADERLRWHFIPTEMFARSGLPVAEMNEAQRKLAHGLLQAGLSARGYQTAAAIMELERILAVLEQGGKIRRDPERYFFSVFGTPSAKDAWGWRAEGHHLSLHFTVVNGSLVAATPAFFGANPAEVREGPRKGLRVLGPEEDAARALVTALDAAQRSKAVIDDTAPNDILTMNSLKIDPLTPAGILAGELNTDQRALLMKLIDAYVSKMAPEIAAERTAAMQKAGFDNVGFAWAGPAARGARYYYRVQGPTFLIEHDNTQGNGNHIHAVWRDFQGDFGQDALRDHLKAVAHRGRLYDSESNHEEREGWIPKVTKDRWKFVTLPPK